MTPSIIYTKNVTSTRFLGCIFKSVFSIGNSKTIYNAQNDNKLKKAMKMLLLFGELYGNQV